MYKLINNPLGGLPTIYRVQDKTSFGCDPANTDYADFKKQINADEAQLEDADGNLMSPEAAKAYVATLP